jgi:hypothetical protein
VNIVRSIYYGVGVSAAILMLAGCSGIGSQSSLAPSGSAPQNRVPDRGRSWMAPNVGGHDLLYISDETGNVYVFTYREGNLVGTLTGLPDPQGECVDKKGDVFITTFGGQEIVEYAHGGTSPIATLQNSGEEMEGCSVDPTTGTLAVINFAPTGGSGGSVSLYADASGSPTVLTDPSLMLGFQVGYDNKGNLFLDGLNSSSAFEFAELPNGSTTFTEISLNVSIATPGGVQWDGQYVAVGDATGGKIYQTNGAGGQIEGTTTLSDSDGIFQFFIHRKKVVGPNVNSHNAMIWGYPAGGSPIRTLTGFTDPFGVALSRAKK